MKVGILNCKEEEIVNMLNLPECQNNEMHILFLYDIHWKNKHFTGFNRRYYADNVVEACDYVKYINYLFLT